MSDHERGLDIVRSKRPTDYAYRMGRDCAVNGPNTTNCHHSIFSSPESTRAWERGKRDAEVEPQP